MAVRERTLAQLFLSASLALSLVLVATLAFLANGLPNETEGSLEFTSEKFNFGLGSGRYVEDYIAVDGFTNGYALLSSGPVRINASSFRVLRFIWRPTDPVRETAFFWRRSSDAEDVFRTEIVTSGFNLVDLSTELDWRGEIIEFGFLFAGESGELVEIGKISMGSDSMHNRLQLMWRAWTGFEEWSQKSINFLYGGERHQIVPLPVLVIAWLIVTISLLWLFFVFTKKTDIKQMIFTGGLLFLVAWIMLDIRWASNNLRQIQSSLLAHWRTDDQQRLSMGVEGEIFQYVQKLKMDILGDKTVRILIIGNENAMDYYLLRAKYYLLPHSVDIARRLDQQIALKSLDFVLFFGQPGEINKVPGWNQSWEHALAEMESGDWGEVYRVNKGH